MDLTTTYWPGKNISQRHNYERNVSKMLLKIFVVVKIKYFMIGYNYGQPNKRKLEHWEKAS